MLGLGLSCSSRSPDKALPGKKKKRKKRSTLALTLFQQPHTAVKNIEVIMEGKGDRELS